MKKYTTLKAFARNIFPYIYFIGLAAIWFFSEILVSKNISFICLVIIMLLILQAYIQNSIAGMAFGVCAVIVNLFFFLAVVAELRDFEVISWSAIELLTVGSVLSLTGLAMGVVMIIRSNKTVVS